MIKVMGNGDVLRCLARHIIYHSTEPKSGKLSKYQLDVSCDKRCEPLGKLDLCIALRDVIDKKDKLRRR